MTMMKSILSKSRKAVVLQRATTILSGTASYSSSFVPKRAPGSSSSMPSCCSQIYPRLMRQFYHHPLHHHQHNNKLFSIVRYFTFSFAGPRKLEDLIEMDKFQNKSGPEVADIWCTYHEGKEGSIGIVLDGKRGLEVLKRASQCPFFVQPVFRDSGFFMLVSQFQIPSHFLLAFLEDYKMDPSSATPLLTFSVFDSFSESKNISLVRADILNKNLTEHEGRKVVESVLLNYHEEYPAIQTFNEQPNEFDIDDYISRMNDRWNKEEGTESNRNVDDNNDTVKT